MSRLGVYDDWGRLVAAVIDREKLRELAFCDSFSSTGTSSSVAASPSRLSSVPAPSITRATTRANGRGGVAALLFSGPLAYYRRKKLREYDLFVSKFFSDVPAYQLDQLERFSLGELQLATDNYSDENILHRGGFGKFYKGRLADGSLVAVRKKTEEHNTNGCDQQFHAEIKMRLNMDEHPNILQLRGFCLASTERILVYPFIANRTLSSCLRERAESQPPLDWPTRERIALSSAKGIAYLHDQCHKKIIHRDIKPANILLNEDLEAVIGDFGFAKFMDHEDTHFTMAIRGTMSHIAPEYRSTGTVSEKTDVFGYGVMLLELSTGQRPLYLADLNYEIAMLLDLLKGLSPEKFEALVDTDHRVNYLRTYLKGNYIDGKVVKLIQVALVCCQGSPEKRPKMSDVIQMLQGDDGLSERWNEYCLDEYIPHRHCNPNKDWIMPESLPIVDELSGPR